VSHSVLIPILTILKRIRKQRLTVMAEQHQLDYDDFFSAIPYDSHK
jgi:hypothetical protein